MVVVKLMTSGEFLSLTHFPCSARQRSVIICSKLRPITCEHRDNVSRQGRQCTAWDNEGERKVMGQFPSSLDEHSKHRDENDLCIDRSVSLRRSDHKCEKQGNNGR